LHKLTRAIISYSRKKSQAVSLPPAVTAIVSGCQLALIRAAPPNYIQVR
jgi:hypothetical protein